MTTRARRGFTLIETVVTVSLLAILAAFVVPTVMKKADSADPVKVANDLNTMSSAIQTFSSDVKGALPGDLEDLTEPLLTNLACNNLNPCDSTVTHKSIYTAQQVALWKGPYMSASIPSDPKAMVRSGYVADISNMLFRYDATTGVPEFCPASSTSNNTATVPCSGFIATNPLFVGIKVNNLNEQQALIVNSIIDGPNEEHPGLQGRFRFPAGGTPAYFLAAPVP